MAMVSGSAIGERADAATALGGELELDGRTAALARLDVASGLDEAQILDDPEVAGADAEGDGRADLLLGQRLEDAITDNRLAGLAGLRLCGGHLNLLWVGGLRYNVKVSNGD